MADNSFFTKKFFESPVYKALQAPYNDRMARESAAKNPLVPSQGGTWSKTPQRPVSTALTPQNYKPTVVPQAPNDPRRATAEMRQPGLPAYPGAMQPFPLAYPDNAPIDITVRGGNQQIASVPMPQPRPWNAPTAMDLAAIAALEPSIMPPPTVSAYAPQPAPSPAAAAAAAQGQAPQTSWMQDMMTGINGLLAGNAPKPMNPSQSYAATNAAAADRARTQDRSGTGTDGYVRDASGTVIGRDAQYQGLTPSQMYDQINGNSGPARIDGNPDNNTFSRGGGVKFGLTAEQRRNGVTVDTGTLRPGLNTRGPAKKPLTLAAALTGKRER